MPPKLPSLQRVREVLRVVFRSKAIPAWVGLSVGMLLDLVDWADRTDFLQEKLMGGQPINWVDLVSGFGWIFGCLWFAGVVLWAAARPPESTRHAAQERLNNTIRYSILQFEALCSAYEQSLVQAYAGPVEMRRIKLMFAVADVLNAARNVLPEEKRQEFDRFLYKVIFDYYSFYEGPKSIFADEASPVYALQLALGMKKATNSDSSSSPETPAAS